MSDHDLRRELEKLYVPPQNLEAEGCVLGAILRENGALLDVREHLTAADFYRASHQHIFRAMAELADKNEPIDIITLSDSLNGHLEAAGGIAYLAELADVVPTAANVGSYVAIVREAARRRQVLEAVQRAQMEVYESTDDAETIAARLTSQLTRGQAEAGGFEHISDVTNRALKDIERVSENSGVIGIRTGLSGIDIRLGGIPRGELWIIAGRPSMGKTALAGSITRGAAERGHGVAFVTIESPSEKVVTRLLAEAVGIENRDLRRAKITEADYPRIVAAAGRLGELPISWLSGERSWDRIKLRLRAYKLKHPDIGLFIVDYIGLLSIAGPKERYLQLGVVSAEAKALAVQLNVGVLLLSQLNRDVEKQADKRPRLSDLRESGNLEQDADVVGLLFRPHYYDEKADRELAELDIAKCRDGDTGVIKLRYKEELTSFSDWAPIPYA